MNGASSEQRAEPATEGEVRLVQTAEIGPHSAQAVADGLLCVEVAPPGPAMRGRLALLIESAIESALEQRGALPPGVGASSDLDASLSDQLYRARQVGKQGLALFIPSLEGVANLAGSLDAEDSAVLRWWFVAARERAVRLLLDSADRYLGVYGPPTALHAILDAEREAPRADSAAPQTSPEVAASAAAMELSAPPPTVADADAPRGIDLCADDETEAEDDQPIPEWIQTPPPERELVPVDIEALSQPAPDVEPEDAETNAAPALAENEPATAVDLARAMARVFEEDSEPAPLELDEPTEVPPPAAEAEPEAPAPLMAHAPLHPQAEENWRGWAHELENARGPKPLAVIERLFVSSYVPLADAAARGIAGDEAAPALASWAASFDKSYSEAFDALRLRGKRPTMVLDVPDVALRIGRLHGARSVQLLLVDALRFDLGLRVQDRLKLLLGRRAALTERLLLWSALPSITSVQLELIGRGAQGLRELGRTPESEAAVARGRSAKTLRRIKVGHRDLMKFDLVEARLSEPGGPSAERLDALADEVAECLANHFLNLPPRTLVMMFGDHGFQLDPLDGGTSAARQGGASPEEVLVPAFAWLVGAVH
jgi:hypothetical protein